MSFGFSVSDFVTVCQLAKKIRKDFVSAPSQLKSISEELRNFSIVIEDIEVALTGRELSAPQRADLQHLSSSCRGLLSDLEKDLSKYKTLQPGNDTLDTRARRFWERLRCEPDDIRDFRLRIVSTTSLLNTVLGGLISQAALDVKVAVDRLAAEKEVQQHRAICDWITLVDYSQHHKRFVRLQHPGTCQRIIQSSMFQAWLGSSQQTLFCYGIPGAGKTILSSIVIEQLVGQFSRNQDVGIAYIYCDLQRKDEQTLDNLLASLLKQLIEKRPSVPVIVTSLYERHQSEGTQPSINAISETLQSILASFSRSFLIIDALDECSNFDKCGSRFIDHLQGIQARSGVNLFLTSRSSFPEITAKLKNIPAIEVRASSEDLHSYLMGQMFRLPGFVIRDTSLQKEICHGIVEAIDGMFQLAWFHIESLVGARSPSVIRSILHNLPRGLNAYSRTYESTMERINKEHPNQRELAIDVLSWIVHARRQLTSDEIRQALAIRIGDSTFDDTGRPDVDDILSSCAGLVALSEETGIIEFVHYTIREYFQQTKRRWFPTAEIEISAVCVTYLSFRQFEKGPCGTNDELNDRLRSNPFYAYSAQNWGHHARHASISTPELIRFLTSEPHAEASVQVLFAASEFHQSTILHGLHLQDYFTPLTIPLSQWYPLQMTNMPCTRIAGHSEDSSQWYPRKTTCMHIAAYFGLADLVAEFIRLELSIDSQDHWAQGQGRWHTPYGGQTPLSWAARKGFHIVVELLLSTGSVQVDSKDSNGRTPLSWASENGHEMVTQLLLDHGADVHTGSDKWGRSPLTWAAGAGHEAIVSLLLSKGAELELKDKSTRTPLSWASGHGHEEIVRRLLERHAEIDTSDKDKRTPLSFAAENGRTSVVRLLLLQGADVDSKDIRDQTPLSYAAEKGREDVVSLLLDEKPEIDSKDRSGVKTSQWCAVYGDMHPISWTVRTGGQTPLNRAAEVGHEAIARMLLAAGADMNLKDGMGRTPLVQAVRHGHAALVKLLVEKGVDLGSIQVLRTSREERVTQNTTE